MVSDTLIKRVLRSPSVVAIGGDLIRVLIAAGVLFLIALCCAHLLALGHLMFDRLHMNDFGKFYYSAQAYLYGGDMYASNPATRIPVGAGEYREFLNMNPPHFHLLILPFALLPPASAMIAWWVVNALALIWTIGLITRALGLRWSLAATIWTSLAVVANSVTATVIVTGQLTFLLTLVVTWCWLTARRGHWLQAGVLLGLAAGVKPFLGLFALFLLISRKWKAAGAMAAAVAASFALGLLLFGVEPHLRWFQALKAVDWMWAPMNGSIGGFLDRALNTTPMFTPLTVKTSMIQPIALVLGAIISVVALVMLSKDHSEQAIDRAFLGVLLTAQVVSPLGWIYYVALGVGPAIAIGRSLATRASRTRDALLVLATPGLVLPTTVTGISKWTAAGSLTFGSIYGWTTLALWIAVLLDLRSARRVADRHSFAEPALR